MTLKHMASRTMRLAYDRDSDVLYIAFGLPQSGLDEEVEPVFFCDGMKPRQHSRRNGHGFRASFFWKFGNGASYHLRGNCRLTRLRVFDGLPLECCFSEIWKNH